MTESVKKRSGKTVRFNKQKIQTAITKANKDVKNTDPTAKIMTREDITAVTEEVVSSLPDIKRVDIEDIQDRVEQVLMSKGFFAVAKSYILYRKKHQEQREVTQKLMEQYRVLLNTDNTLSTDRRENANINTNTPMGMMLSIGTTGMKVYADNYGIPDEFVTAEKEGWCYYHDKDFSFICPNCLTTDLLQVFHGGFDTGHGTIREPQSIRSYAALAAISLQSSQNDMYGGQSIAAFDVAMAEGIRKSFRKTLKEQIRQWLFFIDKAYSKTDMSDIMDQVEEHRCHYSDDTNRTWQEDFEKGVKEIRHALRPWNCIMEDATKIYLLTCEAVKEETHQAMESFLFNMNTLHARAGAQVPFSSINYGMDTTPEGRLAIREMLNVTWNGMGHGETAIFPVQIFSLLEGVNYNPEDINYDLFKYSMKVSAKRLYPNYTSQHAPYNYQYYKPDDYRTWVTTMGCRTRVISNVNGEEIFTGRGNFAFTTIILPKIALEAKGDINRFFKLFDKYINVCKRYLEFRFEIIARKKVKNFPFIMGQKLYMGSKNLKPEDEIRPALLNATLSIGFIGLAEALVALTGKHHGESEEAQELGLQIVSHLREMADKFTKETHMNWSAFQTPAEGLAGKSAKLLRQQYGVIPGVTEHEYLTNSSHVPVYYPICASKKIRIEAPYHSLCNAGAISYIEMAGNPLNNLEVFEQLVRYMYEHDMGYFAISHAVDRCPKCGYTGVIKDECPKCHYRETENISVGSMKRS